MIKLKGKNGITLIALIITIIVLLILAGVVINMTIGNDGIISKAQTAVDKYKNAQLKEKASMALLELELTVKSNPTLGNVVDYIKSAGIEGINVGEGIIKYENDEYLFMDNEGNIIILNENNGKLTIGNIVEKGSTILRKQVSYSQNGGNGEVPSNYNKMVGTVVNVNFKTLPTKNGYGFLGWAFTPDATNPEFTVEGKKTFTMPENDITLYAIWGLEAGNLEYNVNGGNEGTEPDSITVLFTQTEPVSVDFDKKPTRNGWKFLGWDENKDATNPTYIENVNTTFIMPRRNVTLYAIWAEMGRLTYDPNGGTQAPDVQFFELNSNASVTISNKIPITTESGKCFAGWADSNIENVALYKPGDTITLNTNKTIYAVWINGVTSDLVQTSEYGKWVKNYNCSGKNENNGDIKWRLFNIDSDGYIYLISDKIVNRYLVKDRITTLTYLLTPWTRENRVANYSSYVDSDKEEYIVSIVGGPTATQFTESWNKTMYTIEGRNQLVVSGNEGIYNGSGILINNDFEITNTFSGPSGKNYDGLYGYGSENLNNYILIASPCTFGMGLNIDGVWIFGPNTAGISLEEDNDNIGIRPVVKLLPGFLMELTDY